MLPSKQVVQTMSSIELLEVVNSARESFGEAPVRRNDFHARCVDELDGEHYESFVVPNSNNTTTRAFRLTHDQCMYVLMRESKAVRRAVAEKIKPAESQYNVPTTLSGALRLAAEQAEEIERQTQLIEQQRPAVEFVGKYVKAEGSKGFREVCKILKANEPRFKQFLIDEKIMYSLGGHLTPMAQHMDAGRFEVKTGVSGAGHAFNQAKFTPKGVEWIAGEWGKYTARQQA